MIKAINSLNCSVNFKENKAKQKPLEEPKSEILPNTLGTRISQKSDKIVASISEYPVKGLKGDINSDFYEFLSMGIIPYVIGSLMFMGLFNLLKDLSPKAQKFASSYGNKMALGVLMYGAAKTLSNDFVTRPVAWGTGVDIELPIRHVDHTLPTKPGKDADIDTKIQQRKVYDSREFFRKDLIDNDPRYGKKYYANIAKKIGLGENLNDPTTEVTPIIQSIISTTKTAKSLSSYAWAGLGVGLALQNSWDDFFHAISNRKRHVPKVGEGFFEKMGSRFKNAGSNFVDISKTFGKSFVRGCKTLWTGEAGTTGFKKHAGKGAILATLALTIGSVTNVIYRARQMGKLANKDIIDSTKESQVI